MIYIKGYYKFLEMNFKEVDIQELIVKKDVIIIRMFKDLKESVDR